MVLAGIGGLVLAAAFLWASVRFGGVTGGRAFLFALITACLIAVCLWRLWLWRQHHRLADMLVVLGCGTLAHIIALRYFCSPSTIHISSRLVAEINRLLKSRRLSVLLATMNPQLFSSGSRHLAAKCR